MSTSSHAPWAIMRPVKFQIVKAIFLASVSVLSSLLMLCAIAYALAQLFQSSHDYPWKSLMTALLLLIMAFTLRLAAFNQSHQAAFHLENILRTQLSEHIALIPLGKLQQLGQSTLAKIMMDDVKSLHVFVADSTPLYARAYVSPICTFALLCYLNWQLALMATAIVMVGMLTVTLAWKGSTQMSTQYNHANEEINQAIVEYVQAMPIVRNLTSSDTLFQRYYQALVHYKDVISRWYRLSGIPSRLSQIILSPLPTLITLTWLGTWLITKERLDIQTWMTVLLIGTGMAEAMLPLITLKHLIDKTHISIQRINDIFSIPILPVNSTNTELPQNSCIRFENVSFSYDTKLSPVLKNLNFTIPEGSITAIVGTSGSGKSTIARLIPRFWDVSTGKILIGNVDIRTMTTEQLMGQISFVFQETFLFSDSIAENIRLGSPSAEMSHIIAAAKQAQIHEEILQFPNGYETKISELGSSLSGGQRQRITIARAILQDRPILILDEATAHTDSINEAKIIAALSLLKQRKTVLIIAHRLSSICHANQILVLQNGQLVEQGTHHELLQQPQGVYTQLWENDKTVQNWKLRKNTSTTADSSYQHNGQIL